MSSPAERASYRERLQKGDIVYFVSTGGMFADGHSSLLTVQKATVKSTHGPGGWERKYPMLALWEDIHEDPSQRSSYLATSRSPRELFTDGEIHSSIAASDVGEELTGEVDQLLLDPQSNIKLAGILAEATIERMAEDAILNPGDPERP